jgi:quercetin dioxygenase-like cupin family protein
MGSTVVRENEKNFEKVDWGKTKNLFGPENVGGKHLKINMTEYEPGGEHILHRHPDQKEVIFILEGKGITRTGKGDKPIGPGDFVFVPANTDHATINIQKKKR